MDVKLEPRAYQVEAANKAIAQNTILHLRTGTGKTLIAVLVIDHHLSLDRGRVLFIVPTRALVDQQAQYIRRNSQWKPSVGDLQVDELSGNNTESLGLLEWRSKISQYHVLVGTAEVFRSAMYEKGFLRPSYFSLVVFDECHNATGNNPMASILRDSLQVQDTDNDCDRPRILGLTASFVNGSTKNMGVKREQLEKLFNANLFAPTVDEASSNAKTFTRVYVIDDALADLEEAVKPVIESVLLAVKPELGKDFDSWISRGFVVFTELGLEGLRYWLREGLYVQLDAFCEEMKTRRTDPACARIVSRLEPSLKRTRELLRSAVLKAPFNTSRWPAQSQKLTALLELLWRMVEGSPADASSPEAGQTKRRGIVFVEQVSITYPLAFLVNQHFSQQRRGPTAQVVVDTMLPISGSSSMVDRVRRQNLDLFRQGHVPLLVSTNALEEGIDVPACEFVVRFDWISTTKSHIQGSGRARFPHGQVFYFDNDPEEECGKAAAMEALGRNEKLNLSSDALREGVVEMQMQSTPGAVAPTCYPFRPSDSCSATLETPVPPTAEQGGGAATSGASADTISSLSSPSLLSATEPCTGEVNFFNCLGIFLNYVQQAMKQPVEVDWLFEWQEEVVREYPLLTRRVLQSICLPTPEGFQHIGSEEVDAFWQGYSIEEVVLPKERYAKLSTEEKDKRRASFVVVVRLHQMGLLTSSFLPSADALCKTKHACPAPPLGPFKLTLKNAFPADLLLPSAKIGSIAATFQASALQDSKPQVAAPPPLHPSLALNSNPPQPDEAVADYKGQLMRLMQRWNPSIALPTLIQYNTAPSGKLFSCVVTVSGRVSGREISESTEGGDWGKKKEAEQAAARAMLGKLEPTL